MPYLVFDIGSSSLKAAVVSESGELLGISRRSVALRHSGEAYEADAAEWMDAVAATGLVALERARRVSPALEIRALSVSGNGPTLLAVDAAGEPIGPALSWLDRRAVSEAGEVSALAGMTIDPTFYLPKALRIWRRADAAQRRRIRWFFSCPEYVEFRLCGEPLTYLPHPSYEPYIWSAAMIDALRLPPERFPAFAAPGAVAGRLLPESAERLALRRGIPVIAGFPDFLAAIVGSAAVRVGLGCDRAGTSEAINICSDRPFPTRALLSLPHPVEGLWNVSGGVSTAGASFEWLGGILGPAAGDRDSPSAADLVAQARLSPPGALGMVFLPYLAGERAPLWDASRRGAFLGLSADQGRPEMARALCEALAYGLKLASDLAVAEGMPFDLLRVSGMAAGDDFLCELKSDILGVAVEAPGIAECELVGDAAACALALGDAASLAESAAALVAIRRRFEPRRNPAYEDAFGAFKAALAALGPVDGRR